MSGTHPTREEDFDLYALGALDGDEKAAFEAHLASCASCKMKLAEATGRMRAALCAAAELRGASVADAAEKERDLSEREVAIRHVLALLNEVAEHPGGAWR